MHAVLAREQRAHAHVSGRQLEGCCCSPAAGAGVAGDVVHVRLEMKDKLYADGLARSSSGFFGGTSRSGLRAAEG